MDFKPMHYIYKPSANPEATTLLLLHGTGGNEEDLLPIGESFGSHLNILSVRGNILENGMPRFFKRLGTGIFDENDLEFRTNEMIAFLKELAQKEKFDVSKMIAIGYSNGANMAGATLQMYPNFLAGAILFRPMLPFKDRKTERNNNNTPVFISSGKYDPTVNQKEIAKYISLLNGSGFTVSDFEISTGHNLIQKDLDLAIEWFKKIKV
jgi:phospholipase/carboxylesterase